MSSKRHFMAVRNCWASVSLRSSSSFWGWYRYCSRWVSMTAWAWEMQSVRPEQRVSTMASDPGRFFFPPLDSLRCPPACLWRDLCGCNCLKVGDCLQNPDSQFCLENAKTGQHWTCLCPSGGHSDLPILRPALSLSEAVGLCQEAHYPWFPITGTPALSTGESSGRLNLCE